jgi:DNA-binding transcriptional regulator YiaG
MPRNTSAERSIDWASLIQDLCEREVLTQARLGVALHTTQQSVSNWLNGRRMPGPAAAKKLLEMIEAAGLEILDYRH